MATAALLWRIVFVAVAATGATGALTGVDYVGVAIKTAGGSKYSHLDSNSTFATVSRSGRGVFEVCNVNRPCDRSLHSDGICTVVTPTCNCLVWKGIIAASQPVIQLRTPRFACVRFAVSGSAVVTVDWHLRKVGQKIPHIILNTGYSLWRRSPLCALLPFEAYVRELILPQVCKPKDVGPVCRSRTVLSINITNIQTHKALPAVWGVATALSLIALVILDIALQLRKPKTE